ncbi:hypothetical protein GCM10011380_13490 [Sphingomonas metalli]|uniref:DUF3667 domain-containing protein n=2 Tax=Sphingomonas metalli TaxID=1779358 RepID=A0A916T032_9SPHN|nr:hypothetical protein GCM10011380_13490 [Sphingomonas metalli]
MGMMLAHAVEPHDDAHGGGAGGICLNCGTRRAGEFCHICGQSSHVHRSFGAIGHELAHGVFHFEGKIWRTLPMLLFRPGELTRRYIHGERARFVSPLALFLFIIFVLFAMLSVIGAHLEMPEMGSPEARKARIEMEAAIARNGEQLARLSQQRAATRDPAQIKALDGRIAENRRETKMVETTMETLGVPGFEGLGQIHTGWKRLDKGLGKAAENPNLILYKLQSNAYKFAWVLIPFSLPFMWLMFPFSRRFTFYDHAIFVTYSLCFVSLFGIALSMAGLFAISPGLLVFVAMILIPVHMYKQLRGAYGIGRFGALVRTLLMFVCANMALVFFGALLVGLGLVG